jgi:hypothetical protein
MRSPNDQAIDNPHGGQAAVTPACSVEVPV